MKQNFTCAPMATYEGFKGRIQVHDKSSRNTSGSKERYEVKKREKDVGE